MVRQGVQWGAKEMADARKELLEEVDAMTDPARKRAREEEIAAWYDLQTTPPMRRVELAHRAEFRQLVNTHGCAPNLLSPLKSVRSLGGLTQLTGGS